MSDRILIVEDDQDVVRLMAARLVSVGYEVRAVVDGALAIKEAQGFRSNLVVLDLMLPAGGGPVGSPTAETLFPHQYHPRDRRDRCGKRGVEETADEAGRGRLSQKAL